MFEKNARFKKLRKELKYTQVQFAALIKSDQSNIAKIENNKMEIGDVLDLKIKTLVKGLNPIWWEREEGDMFLNEKEQKADTAQGNYLAGPRHVRAYLLEDLVKVPLLDISARAGFIENLDNYSEYITDFTLILPEQGERYDNALAMRIDGDSMEPRLERGDVVLAFFQEKSEWEYLNPGIYAVVYRNSFVIKRIKKNTLQNLGVLELVSDNEIHGLHFRGQLALGEITANDLLDKNYLTLLQYKGSLQVLESDIQNLYRIVMSIMTY